MGHQSSSQISPRAPIATKAEDQPKRMSIQATSGGAMIAPTEDPLLKSPEARARSDSGNHSATTLSPAGQLPASPIPSRNRYAPRLTAPVAKRCRMAATDH